MAAAQWKVLTVSTLRLWPVGSHNVTNKKKKVQTPLGHINLLKLAEGEKNKKNFRYFPDHNRILICS